jgi:hypothetical protein
MSTVITFDQVKSVLPLLPEDAINPLVNGSYVYTGLDGTHCIAGEVLARLGAPLPAPNEPENRSGVNTHSFEAWLKQHDIELERYARRLLMELQSKADGGREWGPVIREVVEA